MRRIYKPKLLENTTDNKSKELKHTIVYVFVFHGFTITVAITILILAEIKNVG